MKNISYSQNFFKNIHLLNVLIKNSEITKNDLVIDIGAGTGTITYSLSHFASKVISIEKDKNLYKKLLNKFDSIDCVKVVNENVLKYKFPDVLYKVFANIPFSLTSDIVKTLTTQKNKPDDIFLFMQKRPAINYYGKPLTRESIKSLLIKTDFTSSIVYQFKRSDFSPSPHVNIVLIRFKKRRQSLLQPKDIKLWKDFISFTFNKSSPNVKKAFQIIFPDKIINNIFSFIKPNSSPGDIDINQWIKIYGLFKKTPPVRRQIVANFYKRLLYQQSKLHKIHRTRFDKSWKDNKPT